MAPRDAARGTAYKCEVQSLLNQPTLELLCELRALWRRESAHSSDMAYMYAVNLNWTKFAWPHMSSLRHGAARPVNPREQSLPSRTERSVHINNQTPEGIGCVIDPNLAMSPSA